MSRNCPNCDRPQIGNNIVELPHAVTDRVSYGVICANCGTVFASQEARKQLGGLNE